MIEVFKTWIYNQVWIAVFKWVFSVPQVMEMLIFEEKLRSQGYIIAVLGEMGRQ